MSRQVCNPVPTKHRSKETSMQWQTPQACDFRFGFEITMYIATR
ncbi:MAG: pyrroloquinoline quinone precursor peptide PqqA [Rhodocyclaceae bacterium]|nr:pyrroloquinoline quinone precursor peptide PqqA [Rhodocyclaceae bacterium]MBX3669996.1 pyrroloquinoline quinone precursor peptide PqqA [Rhodocyclaceae bacterium]